VDLAPAEVYATLLDEGEYLCSERTMYRVLAAHGEARERRDQLRHPHYAAPELLATRPNELWSWDITKLLGPAKWTYFYLYVMLDVFSRYVVGWMAAHRESATLAERFIHETCARQEIGRDQLTIHADRGSAMISKPIAFLLADLGVTKTHSRPHVSNDNPFSEAQFKTLKYRQTSRSASARSRMLARTAKSFSPGTTPRIATPASACSRPTTSTTVWRRRASWPVPRSWRQRTPRIPNDSLVAPRNHRRLPRRSGSIHPRPERPRRRFSTKLMNPLSHSC